jgi:hypothetical protein
MVRPFVYVPFELVENVNPASGLITMSAVVRAFPAMMKLLGPAVELIQTLPKAAGLVCSERSWALSDGIKLQRSIRRSRNTFPDDKPVPCWFTQRGPGHAALGKFMLIPTIFSSAWGPINNTDSWHYKGYVSDNVLCI